MIPFDKSRERIDVLVKEDMKESLHLLYSLRLINRGPQYEDKAWDFIVALAGSALAESILRVNEAGKTEEKSDDNG